MHEKMQETISISSSSSSNHTPIPVWYFLSSRCVYIHFSNALKMLYKTSAKISKTLKCFYFHYMQLSHFLTVTLNVFLQTVNCGFPCKRLPGNSSDKLTSEQRESYSCLIKVFSAWFTVAAMICKKNTLTSVTSP